MAAKSRKKRSEKQQPRQRTEQDIYTRLRRHQGMEPREAIGIGAVIAVALGVRLLYFFINKSDNPLFHRPVIDALFYHDWAKAIAAGDFWGDEVFFRAPLYPYFMAMLYKMSGSSMVLVVLVQHLLGACTVALVYGLCREYFRPAVALTAAGLAALYWPLIYFEGELLAVTLVVCLDVLLLWTITAALRRGRLVELVLAGAVMGLSAIARPSILIVFFVLPVVFSAAFGGGRHRWLRPTVALAIGLAVVVTPVLLRNWIVGRDVVPIASQGGVNFYIGNNPSSNGTRAEVPGAGADLYGTYQGAIEMAEREVGRSMKPSEVSNYYFRKGLDFIIYSPGDALQLTAKKFYYFWAGVERSNNKYIQFLWRKFGLGRFPLPGFWLVGPLGIAGGVLLLRRRRELSLLYLFVLSYMVGVVMFFMNARFRLPVTPVLMIFSAYTLAYITVAVRSRASGLLPALALVVLCFAVVDYDFVKFRGVRAFDEAATYYSLGEAYLESGKKAAAFDAFESAHRINQRYPTRAYESLAGGVDYQLGLLYYERDLVSRSVEAFERVRPNDPAYVPSRRALAELHMRRGQAQAAITALSQILRVAPGDADALLGLAAIYKQAGDETAMAAHIDMLRRAHPGDAAIEGRIRALERGP